jgi:hypothetical protein
MDATASIILGERAINTVSVNLSELNSPRLAAERVCSFGS